MAIDLTPYTDRKMSHLIGQARGVYVDNGNQRRVEDADLLLYANDAINLVLRVKPELYSTTEMVTFVNGPVQSLPREYSKGVTSIRGLLPTNKRLLDRIVPTWLSDPVGTPTTWAPHESDLHSFYVYPPATAGQTFPVSFFQVMAPLTLTDSFPISQEYWSPVVDYVVGMAESRDDPHVLAERAQLFMNKFAAIIAAKPEE